MRHNRFFIINHDLSNNTNDQVFYYTRIVLYRNDDENPKGYPYYPFYLTFKPFRVDFNYYGPSPDFYQENDFYQELKHKIIFSLPLSHDYSVNDRLTTKLIDIYDEESNFDHCYGYNANLDFRIKSKNPNDKNESEEPIFSYNLLNLSKVDQNLPRKQAKTNRISHRTILLDFLFDFNEVKKSYNNFCYCSYFDEIETRLRQNDFFNSLATKYSYYYNHERISEIAADNKGKNDLNSIQKQINKFNKTVIKRGFRKSFEDILPEFSPITSAEEYKLARLLKTHNIRGCYDSLLLFFEKETWNNKENKIDIYDNFVSTYRSKLKTNNARVGIELKKYASIKDQWIRLLEKSNASSFILPINKWWEHFEIEVENIYFKRNSTSRILIRDRDEINRIETAKWFSNRYDVLKSFLLVLSHPFGKMKLTQQSINFQIGSMLFVYFSFLTLIFFWFRTFEEHNNISSKLIYFSFSNIVLIISLTVLFFFSGIINNIIHKKSTHNKLSIRTAGFFLPRLLMAIVSGWLFLALAGEELWKFELDMRFTYVLKISAGILIIMSFFLYLEILKVNPKSWISAFSRALTILYIGLVYSFIVGFFVIVFTSQKIIERSDILEKYAYNIISQNSHALDNTTNNFPQFTTKALKKKPFGSLLTFRNKIVDSLYQVNFSDDSLSKYQTKNWDVLLTNLLNLFRYIETHTSTKNDVSLIKINAICNLDAFDMDVGLITDSIIKSISNNNSRKIDKIKIKDLVKNLVKSKKEITQNLNDIDPKPLLDRYIYLDLLTTLNYKNSVCLVEKVRVPFLNKKENDLVHIFPAYLVLNSFLALFIGVFLQLIFDKKNIAEPL